MNAHLRGPSSPNDFPCLADELAKPHPDMNIEVAAFTVSEKSINIPTYLTEIHDNTLVYLLPQVSTEDLDQGDFQCWDLAMHEDSRQIKLYLETHIHLQKTKQFTLITIFNFLKSSFPKTLSGIPSECQTV